MYKLNLTVTINSQRTDKNGKQAIRIRSTIAGKVKYYPTGISVLPEHWDSSKREVIKHPNRVALNTEISQQVSDIEKRFIDLSLKGDRATVLPNENLQYFAKYAEALIRKREKTEAKGSLKSKRSRVKQFNEFHPNVKLIDCTPRHLEAFEQHCRKEGNCENYICAKMSTIKMILHEAYRDGTITHDPSRAYKKAKYTNPERLHLTELEVGKIERYIQSNGKHSNEANWFLFACYCGLRFGDLTIFDKTKIVNGRVILRTGKTGTDVSIKIHTRLQIVINRLGPNPISSQKYNAKLKLIAAECKIEKKLSSHIARHTFAVLFLTLGGSMEVLSKLMGHTSISITQIYGKIVNKRIDDEVDRVFG